MSTSTRTIYPALRPRLAEQRPALPDRAPTPPTDRQRLADAPPPTPPAPTLTSAASATPSFARSSTPTLGSSAAPAAARHARPGLSLVEVLLSLAITAILLTATMVAIDMSFKAYASAVEQASAQAGTRMVTQRLLTLVRTSTAHGPLAADSSSDPPATLSGNTITSPYIELLDPNGSIVRVEYRPASRELWMIKEPGTSDVVAQVVMGGVTDARFFCLRRKNRDGLWVLDRGTMDLTVQPDADQTISIESGPPVPIRVIASTMPRRLED